MYTTQLFGIPVSVVRSTSEFAYFIHEIVRDNRALYATSVNPHSVYLAQKDHGYRRILRNLDFIYPDGIGFIIGLLLVHGIKAKRISFDSTSLYVPVFKALNQYGRKVFLVGGKPGIVEAAALKIKERFPNVDICGCLDGYRRRDATLAAVVAASPDFVLCGMGAPYQERFIAALRAAGFGGMAFTCGGFLDQLVKREQYYPSLIDKLNMRFGYRLYKEPRRLARRYFVEYWPFLLEVAGSLLAKGNDSGVSHEIESVPVICSLYDPVDHVRRGVQDVVISEAVSTKPGARQHIAGAM